MRGRTEHAVKVIIEVWSDYVCPFCYLELPVLKEVAQDPEVQVRWRAFELRPEPAPLLDPKREYLESTWEGSVYPLAERLGIKLQLPPIQPRSRRALEAAEFARHKGKFDPMHEALFKAFFEKGRNISETAVLLDLAGGVGLNPIDLLGSLEAKEYTPMILGDHKLAARLGIHAVPAMAFHYVNDPVESGVLLTGTRTVSEIEEVVERMKPNAPPPPPPPQPRKRLRR